MSAQFLVHHEGPDDIHPCNTWMEAVETANALNKQYQAWAQARTQENGGVNVRSWAIPYNLDDYRAETGHQIDFSEDEDSIEASLDEMREAGMFNV